MNPYSTQCIDQEDIEAVARALQSTHLTQGSLLTAFESALASYLGVQYVIACNSATSALFMTYKALGFSDTYAITTPISFVATTNMLLACQATPVFCDIGKDGNLDPSLLEETYNLCPDRQKIKAVISVDYGGKSVEVESIKEFCAKHKLFFISDSSHALGGSYKQQKIGSLADATIFSLHAIKSITTAEGGLVATNSQSLYEQLKLLRSHGVRNEGFNVEVLDYGYNFRMNELQSALGLSQLSKLDRFVAVREEIAALYDSLLENSSCATSIHASLPSHIKSSNHLYSVLLNPTLWDTKSALLESLLKAQIGVQVHYKPIHTFKLYQERLGTIHLPQAQDFYKATLSLPCHPKMTRALAKHTMETFLNLCQTLG
ncbi:UDP-4-amino-4,6-dideoxy-N-acetyl-beta-L-altrosamine transaminase [Helicobacter cynogastricus]|uniref:UDP-4-amino-4, 6-dideoxy-N-acetyl-beta-L-altrosamine transaminase n=1 Tax=Helicobacter cynogastricus TaxID=329937 RepID=UPI000CF0F34C|nr:UDP-4-amino-4,6-dideoxy-N-acetyl-beta-L-altrosamine transaminase [Helicobacter cynogastricus]